MPAWGRKWTGRFWLCWLRASATEKLEKDKAEAARILEAVKTGDFEKAAENLRTLLDMGLVSDPETQAKLRKYLEIGRAHV